MSTPPIITPSHVFFYSGGTHYSNHHVTPQQFTDPVLQWTFHDSETCFMAWKARLFGDTLALERILESGHPRDAKALGRVVKHYDEAMWELMRLPIMEWVLSLKYTQNPAWAAELKATGDRILVEASPTDRVWGVGCSIEQAAEIVRDHNRMMEIAGSDAGDGEVPWPGRNLLGQVLVTVRGMLP